MRIDHGSGELSVESYPIKRVTWKIPNFLDLPVERGLYVESLEFPFANGTWCLRVYPFVHEWSYNVIEAKLVRLRSAVPQHRISSRAGFLTSDAGEDYCEAFELHFEGVGQAITLTSRPQHAIPYVLEGGGTATLFCDIHVKDVAGAETSSRTEPSQLEAGAASFLGELSGSSAREEEEVQEGSPGVRKQQLDYKRLLQSGEDSDVLLVVSGKEFRAHRCILRARSAVFSAMFKLETRERESGKVVIDDLDPESFPDFLNHLYSGRVEAFSEENVYSLYSAAEKYDAQDLKSECLEYMQRTLSVDTIYDVITLARRYREEELVALATDFFSKNLDKILVTPKWRMFMRDNDAEAQELLVEALVQGGKNWTVNDSV